jgi:tRNA (mo5U34)-methyltransferase
VNLPFFYEPLSAVLRSTPLQAHAGQLADQGHAVLRDSPHGDQARWLEALSELPRTTPAMELAQATPSLGGQAPDPGALRATLQQLHPWRKGPLNLGGVTIDSEWRSDLKWDRIASHLDLAGENILDVGSGNGYFGLRMLGAGANSVLGIDPTRLFVMQWAAMAHFAPGLKLSVLPLRDTELSATVSGFDSVFSMGVLYHRRNPAEHLSRLSGWLKPGGRLVLETLVVNSPGDGLLVPQGRYARMRNVWYIPGPDRMADDLAQAGFDDVQLLDVARTRPTEQRSTDWMRFESLEQCLDPADPDRTVEGLPAPVRAVFIARAPV